MNRQKTSPSFLTLCLFVSLAAHAVFAQIIFHAPKPSAAFRSFAVQYEKGSAPSQRAGKQKNRNVLTPLAKTEVAEIPAADPAMGASVDGSALGKTALEGEPILGSAIGLVVNYPRLSRMLGEEGRVIVLLTKDSRAKEYTPSIELSSGHARLDQAALKAVQESLARDFAGLAEVKISFVFKLSGSSE